MAHYVIQCHDGNLVMEADTFESMRVYIPYFNAMRHYTPSNTIEWMPPYVDETTYGLFSRERMRQLLAVLQFGCIRSLLTRGLFDLSDALGGVEGIERWDWREDTRYALYREDERIRDTELAALDAYTGANGVNVIESIVETLNLSKPTTFPDYLEIYPTHRYRLDSSDLNRDAFFTNEYVLDQVGMLQVKSVLALYRGEVWLVGETLMRMLNGLCWTEHHMALTTTRDRALLILDAIYNALKSSLRYMIRTGTDIIFYMRQSAPYIVSLTLYRDIQHVLLHTGLDCYALATDGDTVVALPRCTRSLIHNCVVLDPRFASPSYARSVADVWRKGVHVVCPGYTSDWEKYIPCCDEASPGLAGIMACMYRDVAMKRVSHISVETVIAEEIERVHGEERRKWYASLERMSTQELFLTQYQVRIPLIVTTYWPDVTDNQGDVNNQWAGVCMERYIPATTLSPQITFLSPVRVERDDEFYRSLICYE